MKIYKQTEKYAKDFITRNKKYVNQPIAFYYEKDGEFIVINNISFSCKELRYNKEKDAIECCKKLNKI